MTADELCKNLIYKELWKSEEFIENAYAYLKQYNDTDNPECVDIARKYVGRMYMDVKRAMFYMSRAGTDFEKLKAPKITFCIDGKKYTLDPEGDLVGELKCDMEADE